MLLTQRDNNRIRVKIPRANINIKEYKEFLNKPPRRS